MKWRTGSCREWIRRGKKTIVGNLSMHEPMSILRGGCGRQRCSSRKTWLVMVVSGGEWEGPWCFVTRTRRE